MRFSNKDASTNWMPPEPASGFLYQIYRIGSIKFAFREDPPLWIWSDLNLPGRVVNDKWIKANLSGIFYATKTHIMHCLHIFFQASSIKNQDKNKQWSNGQGRLLADVL